MSDLRNPRTLPAKAGVGRSAPQPDAPPAAPLLEQRPRRVKPVVETPTPVLEQESEV